MKTEILRNDRNKQFAIRIKPEPERPFEEFLVLPPMEQREYLATLAEGEVFRQRLIGNLWMRTFEAIYIKGDARDLNQCKPLGFFLECTGWTGFGNECGLNVDSVGRNHELIL